MVEIRIGERLRELRKQQGLTLRELSKLSGVQIATLSRIEHNKMTGTVAAHAKLAYFLNMSLSDFYKGIEIKSNLIKPLAEEEASEFLKQGDVNTQLLIRDISSKKLIPTLLSIEPGGKSTLNRSKTIAEEFIYVLKGCVEITVGEKVYKLNEGNTFYFNVNEPHKFANLRKTKAKLICVRSQ